MPRVASAVLAALLAVPLSFAAEDVGEGAKPRLVEPQAVFTIQHVEGVEYVQMHWPGDVYDETSVRAAIDQLAQSTGSTVENFQYIPVGAPDGINKASFVTQNLIDTSTGDIRLQPVVRAFMKGAKGKVDSFSISIVGLRPNPYNTLAAYNSKAVALRAFYDAVTPSIEYRILVMADDPNEVGIPPRHMPDEMVTQGFEEPANSRLPLLIGLIALAGASAGALVYFALLGKRA